MPSGLVTLNVSVRHCVNSVRGIFEAATVALFVMSEPCFRRKVTVAVEVLGPEITKVSKSSLN